MYQGIYGWNRGIFESHVVPRNDKNSNFPSFFYACKTPTSSHRQESERFAKRVGGSPNLGCFRQVKNPGGFGTVFVGYLGMNGR